MLIGSPRIASAQQTAAEWADSARKAIETASLAADVQALVAARALVERALTRFPDDGWLLHYRGYALYREANVRQGRGREKDVDQYFEQAQEALEKSLAKVKLAETHALLSSVIGQQIGSNPIKGMTLGPRSNGHMDDAVKLAPSNPRVWLLRGIGAIFTPRMFGGGEERAEQYLRKAISLFDQDHPTAPSPSWGKDEAWIWLGQVHAQAERYDEARKAYDKALEIEPNNLWVRVDLIPQLEKKRK